MSKCLRETATTGVGAKEAEEDQVIEAIEGEMEDKIDLLQGS